MLQAKQHGISMIELLVALLISTFLVLGVTQVYLDNRENLLFQQNQGSNIENARFSILILEQELSKAGYRRRPDEDMSSAFPSTPECGGMGAGQVVKRIDQNSFCIRYQPAFTGAKTCDGIDINVPNMPYVSSNPVTEIFSLKDLDTTDSDTSLQLTCNDQVIATNISSIRYQYGINENDEKAIIAYTTSPAPDVNIRSIQFSVLAESPNEVTKEPGSVVYEHLFNSPPTDKKLYTMLSTSTRMRNLMP